MSKFLTQLNILTLVNFFRDFDVSASSRLYLCLSGDVSAEAATALTMTDTDCFPSLVFDQQCCRLSALFTVLQVPLPPTV